MSQLTRAVLGSWGLIVGWNIAPPPPGPTTLKSPGREPLAPNRKAKRVTWRKKANAYFPLLSLSLFRFLFVRYSLLCQSLCHSQSACRRAIGANAATEQHLRSKPFSVSRPANPAHKSATAPAEVLALGRNRNIR